MPKAKKLPSGNWRVRVFTHTDAEGKSHYKSFTAATKKEAEYMASQFYVEKTNNNELLDITLKQAYEKRIKSVESVLSPSTIKAYKRYAVNYLQDIMPLKLSNLTPEIIQTAVSKEALNVSAKTVNNMCGLLSVVLKAYMPSFKLDVIRPQKEKKNIYIPNENEVKQILAYLEGTPGYMPVLLASCLGLRRSEICALKWSDIDFEKGTVYIHSATVLDSENKAVTKKPKSYSGYRTLTMPQYMIEKMKTEKSTSTSENVTTLTGAAIYHRFARSLEALNIPHFRFHDLRHYNASVMLAMGIPNKYAQARMGHATDNMLKNVYQHIMEEKQSSTDMQMKEYFEKFLAT